MNPSREYLQECSIQTGYQIAPLEKVVRLGEMAGDITRHPFLGKVLYLKAGPFLTSASVLRKGSRLISTTTILGTSNGKRCLRTGHMWRRPFMS